MDNNIRYFNSELIIYLPGVLAALIGRSNKTSSPLRQTQRQQVITSTTRLSVHTFPSPSFWSAHAEQIGTEKNIWMTSTLIRGTGSSKGQTLALSKPLILFEKLSLTTSTKDGRNL